MTDDLSVEDTITRDLWEAEHESALRAHQRDHTARLVMFQSVMDFSVITIKTTTLITGGSVVIGLAFVSSLFSSQPTLALSLLGSVFIFALGSILGGVAAGFSYLTQMRYAEAAGRNQYQFEHPFVVPNSDAKLFQKKGVFWHSLAVISVIASYLCIIGGVAFAWYVLSASGIK